MASCVARRQRRRSFHHSDAVLHRLLHLLEGTRAYLAHALARDAELVRELLERDRFFGEPACLEDATVFELNKAGRVATWPRQTVDEAVTDGVDALCHDDRYGAGNLLQGGRGGADTSEDPLRAHRAQFCCIFPRPTEITSPPPIIDAQIS